MSIPDDTMRRLIALRLGDKLEPVMEIIADALEPRKRKAEAKVAKGTRLTPDWLPSAADTDFVLTQLGLQQGQVEIQKFVNYWVSKTGAGATKLDWSRTFRNWVLNAADRRDHARVNGNGIYDVRQQLDDRRQRATRNPDLFDPSDD